VADNVVQTLQHLLQDVIAPDVRELKVRVSSLEKQMDVRFNAVEQRFAGVEQRFEAMDGKLDFVLKTVLSAISESRAQSDLATMRLVAPLSERVAVLEARANS
jgi:hypothetical protein